MKNGNEENMVKWIKLNIFSIITFIIMVVTGIVYLGNIPTRIIAAENQISINTVRLNTIEKNINDFIFINNSEHVGIKVQLNNIDKNVTKILENIIDKGMK